MDEGKRNVSQKTPAQQKNAKLTLRLDVILHQNP
jgi:hypothetical protein